MKKKGHYIPVNSPESFAICRRIAEEERKRRGKMVNPISGEVVDRKPRKPRVTVTPDMRTRVSEMKEQGLSNRVMAEALGVSEATIQRIRKKQEEKYGH